MLITSIECVYHFQRILTYKFKYTHIVLITIRCVCVCVLFSLFLFFFCFWCWYCRIAERSIDWREKLSSIQFNGVDCCSMSIYNSIRIIFFSFLSFLHATITTTTSTFCYSYDARCISVWKSSVNFPCYSRFLTFNCQF